MVKRDVTFPKSPSMKALYEGGLQRRDWRAFNAATEVTNESLDFILSFWHTLNCLIWIISCKCLVSTWQHDTIITTGMHVFMAPSRIKSLWGQSGLSFVFPSFWFFLLSLGTLQVLLNWLNIIFHLDYEALVCYVVYWGGSSPHKWKHKI